MKFILLFWAFLVEYRIHCCILLKILDINIVKTTICYV